MKWVRRVCLWLVPGDVAFSTSLFSDLIPMVLKEIKYHRDTLTPSMPRNFIGLSYPE